jgi:hypothetical protein
MTTKKPAAGTGPHSVRAPGRKGRPLSAASKMARAVGMSRHQMYQALQVADIPEDEFERLVEGAEPPTVTEFAAIGRSTRAPAAKARPSKPTRVVLDLAPTDVLLLDVLATATNKTRAEVVADGLRLLFTMQPRAEQE